MFCGYNQVWYDDNQAAKFGKYTHKEGDTMKIAVLDFIKDRDGL